MTALFRGWVEEALAVAGLDKGDAEVRDDWSVTGPLSGEQPCFAVMFDSPSAGQTFLVGLGAVQERTGGFNAVELARVAEVDRLSDHLVHVLCFPGWTLSDR